MTRDLRVAVVSDIHGNLQALEAVLADIERRGPFDRLIAAGDYCLNGPDPAAALDLIAARADVLLKGNTDRDIVDRGAQDPDIGDGKRKTIEWTRGQLGDERIAFLDGLQFSERVGTMLVVHANPYDMDRHIFPELSDQQVQELVGNVDADLIVFGHFHVPFQRWVGDLRLCNIASVGLPRDGDRRAVWGSFEWSAATGWSCEIVRVTYEFADTALRMLDSGMPNVKRRLRDVLGARYEPPD